MLTVNIAQENGVYQLANGVFNIMTRNSVLAELAASYLFNNHGIKKYSIVDNNIDNSPSFINEIHKYFIDSLKHYLHTKNFRIANIKTIASIQLLSDTACHILRLNGNGDFIVVNQSLQLVCCSISISEAQEFMHSVGIVIPKTEQTYTLYDISEHYTNYCSFELK
ncbi:hypothetical protein [Photobacterium sp. GB-72]|uniref:hypothetical protein n=1 Tax=Photobacterium sp. GB-72 TaxID=2022105 RepID=UPI000D1541E4|nr:hypothetical protein [Photobacterium sp. GB-72]PSV28098.1 hypothetical protein C9J40_19655 [Photobacterium sp. GB-72]